MEKYINKIYAILIGLLLTVIGFFLTATFVKINETNESVYAIRAELAAMRERESHFMTYPDTAQLIDRKINQYHHPQR